MGSSGAEVTRRMFDEAKRYMQLVQQDGKPAVAADFNDGAESFYTQMRRIIQNSIGDGAHGDAFKIEQDPGDLVNNFKIKGGGDQDEGAEHLFADGHPCQLWADESYKNGPETTPRSTGLSAEVLYDSAANMTVNEHVGKTIYPNIGSVTGFTIISNTKTSITVTGGSDMTTVAQSGDQYRVGLSTPVGDRTDLVYLDIYLDEFDKDDDPDLEHNIGITFESARRWKLIQQVFVLENWGGVPLPAYTDDDGNRHVILGLAQIERLGGNDQILDAMITDLRPKIFYLQEVEDRYVNADGDTMRGDLDFDPGAHITGTDVVEDPGVLKNDVVTQEKLDIASHLLDQDNTPPSTRPIVHDNRYHTQEYIDNRWGMNLISNPNFKQGWLNWNNEYPYVLDGFPITEALDDVRLGRRLCCDGGIQIDIDTTCHACEMIFFSQDYDFLCEACIEEAFLYLTFSIPKLGEGNKIQPFFKVDFWSQDEYLGFERLLHDEITETGRNFEMEARARVPRAATKMVVSVGAYLDHELSCFQETTIIIHHVQVRSIQPIEKQPEECCMKHDEPVIRDVTNQGVIEYERAYAEEVIEIWEGPYQKWTWDPISEITHGYDKIFEQISTDAKSTGGDIVISSPTSIVFEVDATDAWEGSKSAKIGIPDDARYIGMQHLPHAPLDMTNLVDLQMALKNLSSDVTKVRIRLVDSTGKTSNWEKGPIPAGGWGVLRSWLPAGEDAGFNIADVVYWHVELFGDPVTVLAAGDFKIDDLAWYKPGVPAPWPLPELEVVTPCTPPGAMMQLTESCTWIGFHTIAPTFPGGPANAIGASFLSISFRSYVEIPPGALLFVELRDGFGGCASTNYILPFPIPEAADPGDPCIEVLIPCIPPFPPGWDDPCPGPWAPLAWDNINEISISIQPLAPVSSLHPGEERIWIDDIYFSDGMGPAGVQPFIDMFDSYPDTPALLAFWTSECLDGWDKQEYDTMEGWDGTPITDGWFAEAFVVCPDTDQAHLSSERYEGSWGVHLPTNVQSKFINAEWYGAPKNLGGAPADLTLWLLTNPASLKISAWFWDILGNLAIFNDGAGAPVLVPASSSWQQATLLPYSVPVHFDWTQVVQLAFKFEDFSEIPVQIYMDKVAINGEALVLDDFEGYAGDGDLWATWYTNSCGPAVPTGVPMFDVGEEFDDCTPPLIVFPADDGQDVRYYGEAGYWGGDAVVVPGRYNDNPESADYVNLPGQKGVLITVGGSYVFQETGPKIEVFCDGPVDIMGASWAAIRIERDGIEVFNDNVKAGEISAIEVTGYGPAERFTIMPTMPPPIAWPLPYDEIEFDMGAFGGVDVIYGYLSFQEPPDFSCRNIFFEPVYKRESHQRGLEPTETTYTFYDHPCECRQEVTIQSFGEMVWDPIFYKILPDDGFMGMPTEYGESFKLKYYEGAPQDDKIWMGTQLTSPQVKFAGGGREDPDFGPEINYVTIWMGPGSAEVVGNHSRESLLSVDANLAAAMSHVFTVDPTEIGKWGVGMKVWVRNQCHTGGAGGCKIKCCDIVEEAKQPAPDANVCGAYGEITNVNPGAYQITVTFTQPVTALFATAQKAEILVSPYQSTFYGAMGFYWEMSPTLVAHINSFPDPFVWWWFQHWEGELAECEPEIEGAVFIGDGDGATEEHRLVESTHRQINPMDWWPLFCGPAYSEELYADALPTDEWVEVCDADSWTVGDLVWLFSDTVRHGFLAAIIQLDPGLNKVRLKEAIPSAITGYPVFGGFLMADNARIMKATAILHYCLNPTEVQNTDMTPKDGPDYATVNGLLGVVAFDPSITEGKVGVHYTTSVAQVQLPTSPGIYRLASVRQPGGRTKLSQDVKVGP